MAKASVVWERVKDTRAFLEARGTIVRGPHQMRSLRGLPWPYCQRCGLLALKNDPTRAALRKECVTEE